MDEELIKKLLKRLIEKIIIPKYPFLEIHSLQPPSESINPMAVIFLLTLTTNIELDYKTVKMIKRDINDLFKVTGFNNYKFRGHYFGIITAIADKDSKLKYKETD
jgi:hypothetical protein